MQRDKASKSQASAQQYNCVGGCQNWQPAEAGLSKYHALRLAGIAEYRRTSHQMTCCERVLACTEPAARAVAGVLSGRCILIFQVQVDVLVLGVLVHNAIGPSAHTHSPGPVPVKLGRPVAGCVRPPPPERGPCVCACVHIRPCRLRWDLAVGAPLRIRAD